jgi:hypothetical protein
VGGGAEQVLGPAEVLRAAAMVLDARRRGVLGVPVLDLAAAVIPSRLAALQVIECLATVLDRRDLARRERIRERRTRLVCTRSSQDYFCRSSLTS